MKVTTPSIVELDTMAESLPPEEKALFQRIFYVDATTGYLEAPETMYPWIEKQFGSVEEVSSQKIIKVTNLITYEGALFNKLRSSRPIETSEKLRIEAQIIDAYKKAEDGLRLPEQNTPQDLFGRVEGKYCITASNIAKYDGLHGIVIFKDFNPLYFTEEKIVDYLDTGWQWAQKAHQTVPSAQYYLFLWNSLRRAGASLLHGHAQVTLSRGKHYAKIESLRRAALRYQGEYDSNYFDDIYTVHHALGCAFEKDGVRILAYLTPIKEKEAVLYSREFNLSLKKRIYEVLACFRDRMQVTAFNFVLITPPLGETEESWKGFPVIARMVDRGDPKMLSCDIGSMELYASSVISSDPFEVARLLKDSLGQK